MSTWSWLRSDQMREDENRIFEGGDSCLRLRKQAIILLLREG